MSLANRAFTSFEINTKDLRGNERQSRKLHLISIKTWQAIFGADTTSELVECASLPWEQSRTFAA